MPDTNKVNLESLLTKKELEQLKDIRLEKFPAQMEKLGEGASGEVFLFKFEDGNFRAGKKPRISTYNKSEEEKENIKKHLKYALGEISILHQLSHERIIKFFGFHLDQDQIIIFMEVMEGSVKNEINKKKYLSEMEAMHYFIQAAEGLVYLHSRKPRAIIHRDIKCDNLLLTVEKNVKLADFGLAVDLAISSTSASVSSTAPTSFAGTYLFTAPEVIGRMNEPEAYGRKSDVWSLACTLVQMISGKPPYSNLSFFEFAQRSSNISSRPSASIFNFFYRSSTASNSPLMFSGDLLPTASNMMKQLLNSLFTVDSKLRPSAKHALALAHGVISKAAAEDYSVAVQYYDGRDVPQSDEEACKWFAKAAEHGHADAQDNLGFMYDNGRGVPQSGEDAVKWYRKAAEQGHSGGQNNLGFMYDIGRGVPQSDEEACKWYRKAAEQEHAVGQYNLGVMYLNGQGVPQSDKEACKWLRKAADQGDASAQYKLGFMYDNGRGVPQSDEEACKWYRNAAEQGNAGGQNNLGNMYRIGRAIPQSDEEAVKWYRKAAEQGHANAQHNLGDMCRKGRGVPSSNVEAKRWYMKAAGQGNADSQNNLGIMYGIYVRTECISLRGVPAPECEEACKWLTQAAEQGHANAQFNLGLMYRFWQRIPQCDEEAVKWYRKAAEQGHASAQYNLGGMYSTGRGVPQSSEEAFRWYGKAAEEQRNSGAKITPQFMYSKGKVFSSVNF